LDTRNLANDGNRGEIVNFIRQHRWIIVGIGAATVVVAFLAFRPDKLFVDDAVDESLSDAFTTTTTLVSADGADEPAATTTTTAPEQTTTTIPSPSEPTAIAAGAFFGIDHSAEGTATVYEQNGKYALRFEDDTDIQNGPDLYVWLLESDDYEGGTPEAYIDLGKIKGNVGGQNYELPAEYDPAIHKTVLVWCLRFATPFAAAPLG
jgi:hypothetical protein